MQVPKFNDPAVDAIVSRLMSEGKTQEQIVLELVALAAAAPAPAKRKEPKRNKRMRTVEAMKIVRDILDDQIRRWEAKNAVAEKKRV